MLKYMHDVNGVTGTGHDISDHSVVLCKVRLVDTDKKEGEIC